MAQKKQKREGAVYRVNRWVELPATVGIHVLNSYGFKWINSKPVLDSTELAKLDPEDVWQFDRRAIFQDVSKQQKYIDMSDILRTSSVFLPVFLMFDKKIRKDWFDLLILYGETHGINSAVYILTARAVDRIRPLAYNPEVDYGMRSGSGTKVSFYSGHVSTTSTSSFFTAKVYCDYHPELGNKKYLIYLAALVPPAVVGFYRVKGMKHFPTDVIMGTAAGAAVGILVPHLHKIKKKESNLSFIPFTGYVTGLKLKYVFD